MYRTSDSERLAEVVKLISKEFQTAKERQKERQPQIEPHVESAVTILTPLYTKILHILSEN